MTTPSSHVRTVLAQMGIHPSEPEVQALEAGFADAHARMERLWQIDIGDTPPALVLRAAEWTGPDEVVR